MKDENTEILFLEEVAAQLRAHPNTTRRWVAEGKFVAPISPPHCKLRWRKIDVLRYLELQALPPVCVPVVSNPKLRRQEDKDFQARQDAARAALERHRRPSENRNS